jgi:hypothetical protein
MELDVTAQQFVILGKSQPAAPLPPIGSRREVLEALRRLNTMPERNGDEEILYGPGICVQIPSGVDPITQMIVSITEEEIAWHVIRRLVRRLGCRLVDPATGREFGS